MQYIRITSDDVFDGSYGFVKCQAQSDPDEYIVHLFREDNVEKDLAFSGDEFEHVTEEEFRTAEVVDA